jgi:hypothetical protein
VEKEVGTEGIVISPIKGTRWLADAMPDGEGILQGGSRSQRQASCEFETAVTGFSHLIILCGFAYTFGFAAVTTRCR